MCCWGRPLAAQIPTALLAGILIKVGLDIIDWGFLLRAHRLSAKTAALMYAVLLMTVFWDLIWGVLVGMFVANLLTVDAITRSQLEGMEEDNPSDATDALHANLSPEEEALILRCGKALMLFRLRGPLSFGAAKGISARMGLIQSYRVLILDLTDVSRIGVTATLAIERMVEEARSAGRTLFIAGANPQPRTTAAPIWRGGGASAIQAGGLAGGGSADLTADLWGIHTTGMHPHVFRAF